MLAKKIFLMITKTETIRSRILDQQPLFSIVELCSWQDQSRDVTSEVLLSLLHGFFSHFLLLLIVIEDDGHVLSGAHGGGVVIVPENLKKITKMIDV